MYIRFITEFRNEDGDVETGVFQALAYLIRSGHAFEYDLNHLKDLKAWFNAYLDKPKKFSKSKRSNAEPKALSWFKDSAIRHLEKMYELKAALEKYDITVSVVKKEQPGYIIYEDDYQVATLPFKADRHLVK